MSSDDIDQAIQRVREAFDDAADEAEEISDRAMDEFREAIDDLENRVADFRGRE